MSSQLEAQDVKIAQIKEKIEERQGKVEPKMGELEGRLRDLQLNRPAASTNAPKVKTPSFDGTMPFQVFKLQFEKTATANHWNMEDKSAALFVALKGPAAEILQTIPNCERKRYGALNAVERRYGSEHRKQIYQMELENRCQKPNETLQEFVSEIEKLAHSAIGVASGEHLERVKIQKFINGMRGVYTKRETYANPKPTFAETVSYAQTRETAALLNRSAYKAHRVEVETPDETNEILKKIIQLLGRKSMALANVLNVESQATSPAIAAEVPVGSTIQQNANAGLKETNPTPVSH
ncbi:PREDICTED: uncharacterized protein LOC108369219 [Rhagoletis zephyria]|uniref:uncharacterized protein LOC108369219 n=1 Tax=Rhagoletis zephyria TaxID=28612 RepID=UPI0008112865|nr:PREDICTED: uncharacterized protein LOC108369219 [Rhagoletis zephyria]